MNFLALLLRYGPAGLDFVRRHGPLLIELSEAVTPVLRKMVEQDVPHAATVLALLDQTTAVVAGVAQAELPVTRPETAGG